jgi:2-polyprenyl-3-methyl-5-hydroxy-6-metoxy-1,4-benzoquinol methylase
VQAHPESYLERGSEFAEYERHQNDANDAGYRKFVGRLYAPLAERISPPARVLDFGCGKDSALSALFREGGYEVDRYDPFYFPDTAPLEKRYELIVLSEVLEHLHHPAFELERLDAQLEPGGFIGIQTQRLIDAERFATWRYKDDPTHVAFYGTRALEYVARRLRAELELSGPDVALLRKPDLAIDD